MASLADQIKRAVAVLAGGGVIAHPTETVFGLAADPGSSTALEKLLALKGRAEGKGFILLIPDRAILPEFIQPDSLTDPLVNSLIEKFWPGPLTLVLPALSSISPLLTGGRGTVAVRHSSSVLVQDLLKVWGGAVVSTSANRADTVVLCDRQQVFEEFGAELGYVVSGLCKASSMPSTILEAYQGQVRLLRPGAVSTASIQDVLWGVDPLLTVQAAVGGSETPPQ